MYSQTILIGRLTKDPEVKPVTINGEQQSVANFSIATDGERQGAPADFHNIVAWRKLAENCGKFLSKGRLVLVVGRTKTRSYEGQNGQRVYVTEVIADNVKFLDSVKDLGTPNGGGGQQQQQQYQQRQPQQQQYQQQQQQYQQRQQTGFQQQPQNLSDFDSIPEDDLPF